MTDQGEFCPSVEVQHFQFKEANPAHVEICEPFTNFPLGSNLIAADGKRGVLYLGHENKLIVFKPRTEDNPEWNFEIDIPDKIYRIALSCDYSLLAIVCSKPSALIYDTCSINKHKLELLHEIRLSCGDGDIYVVDIKWNPAIPEMLCTITSDHTIGCFQVNKDKKNGVQIIGMEKAQGLEALCVSWSPKGKQIVIGCKNGDIIQLKPELKLARHLSGPNPNEGIIIAILWVSNYQFCACYFQYEESRINVMIVDAPKGVTVPKFTSYEDITFGSGPVDELYYYLEHVPEWGIIVAASSHSSEIAVLGTSDNGNTWNLWQLMDGCTIQLPICKKTKNEMYPVGIAIDKSSTQKLALSTDFTLPEPVPVLRILVTSGQLSSYNMVNLKENAPALCTPPTEKIPAPLRRPNIPSSEVSFNLQAAATSTPRAKQAVQESVPVPTEKSKPANIFGNANSSFSFLAASNKSSPDIAPQKEIKNTGLFSQTQSEGKATFFQQDTKTNKPVQTPQAELQLKQSASNFQQQSNFQQPLSNFQQPNVSSGFSFKPDVKSESKAPVVSPQIQQTGAKIKKDPPQYQEDVQSKAKETLVYDNGLCLQAYQEEKTKFEKELKIQLELPAWNCGTEDERIVLVKKTEEINEFLKELRETTDSLSSDITYLKALLLQSFAWLEESKSKNSANFTFGGKMRGEPNKLAELQRLYYYVQSQLTQATKVLDLQWSEHNNREMSKMKIPSPEAIYTSLMRYNQIIIQEKKNIDDLSKKWRALSRGSNNLSNLDRSMASLNISHSTSFSITDAAIDVRCQLIAKTNKNFSKEKQIKLRDLLSESAPRIVRAARPTAVQDRLEATLTSLASSKTLQSSHKAKPNKVSEQQKLESTKTPVDVFKSKSQNPLSSLDNLISTIPNSSSVPSMIKSPTSVAPFSTYNSKSATTIPAENLQLKSKENISLSFGQQPSATYSVNKPVITKVESLNFNICSPTPRTLESQISVKNTSNELPMPNFSFGKSSETSTSVPTTKASGFSFSATSTPPNFTSISKADSSSVFKFSSKTSTPQAPTSQPALGLSNLSFGTNTVASTTPAFSFGKTTTTPPHQITNQSTPHASPSSTISVDLFKSNKAAISNPSTPVSTSTLTTSPTTSASIFGTSSMFSALSTSAASSSSFNFSPASTNPTSATTTAPATTSSMFGGFSSAVSSSMPSFSGILSGTASMSFGTGTSSETSVTPAFGKSSSTNIFGSKSPTNSSTSTTSIFGGKSDSKSEVKITAANSSPNLTSATVSSTSTFGGTTTKVTTTTTTSSMFGNITSTTSSSSTMFGGQTQKPTSSSETNIFGAKTTSTTAASSSSSIFGGTATSSSSGSVFGSASTPSFGIAAATTQSNTGAFGSSGSSLFGSNSAPSMFGNSGSMFGTAAATKTSTATSVFGGAATSSENTSVFGATTTTSTTQQSVFGTTVTSTTSGSLFGSATPTTSSSIFGTAASTSANTPVFRSTTSTSAPTSVFGAATASTAASSIFGAGTSTVASSVFGSTASSTSASLFGSTSTATTSASLFGKTPTTGTASVFGNAASSTSSTSVFGSPLTTTGSLFGKPVTTTTASSLFGSLPSVSTTSAFGSSPMFGSSATTPGASVFGSPTNATTASSMFGSSAAAATTTPTVFGSAATGTSGSLFGATPQQTGTVFGASTGGSMFGGSAVLGSGNSMFGAPASPSSAFGQAPTSPSTGFGQAPAFGSTSPSQAFGAFGSPAAFGAAASPSFGSPSMGSTSPAAAVNTSPGKFNTTFEALGAQTGGLSFGSLAQKTPDPKPQSFQGSSSFSSWR